jgi:hypothetical protein
MNKPIKEKVFEDVKYFISKFTNRPVSNIKNEYELQKHPLKMDTPKLNFMALSLRGYIKNHNPSKTILAKEVKKSGVTVLILSDLVNNKINE